MAEVKTIKDGLREMAKIAVRQYGELGPDIARVLRFGADRIDQLERELTNERLINDQLRRIHYGAKPSFLSRLFGRTSKCVNRP